MSYDEKIVHNEFFDESQNPKPYKKEIHPVELFVNGNLDVRSNVFLTHLDVITARRVAPQFPIEICADNPL